MRRLGLVGVAFCIAAAPALAATGHAQPRAQVDVLPPGFVHLADVDPSILQDIRYAGARNFLDRPAAGYEAGACVLTRVTAEALARVQQRLLPGYALKVLDCYRPARAVADFAAWAANLADQKAKARHYPTLDKARLFGAGFLSRDSRHSRGVAVDLTIVALDSAGAAGWASGIDRPCEEAPQPGPDGGTELDFGTSYDCFHELSATAHPGIGLIARRNRDWLAAEMARAGFRNYAREWWHFELYGQPETGAHDFPVRAP